MPDIWLGFGADYRAKAGVDVLSAQQVADVIVFLCSPAASGVNGVTLLVDSGHVGAAIHRLVRRPHHPDAGRSALKGRRTWTS